MGSGEPNEDQDGREEQAGGTDAGRGCWEFPCSIKAVDLYSLCLEGCGGGGDSSSFLAKTLLGGGLALVLLALAILRNLQNKRVSKWRR